MEYGNIARVNLVANTADRTPIPDWIDGLPLEFLTDCSWTGNAEVMGIGWWPVEDRSPALIRYQRYGDEVLTVDPARQVVLSVRQIIPWDPAMIAADRVRIKAEIVGGTQARLDLFAKTRNYDSILSATTYYNSTIPQFAAEGHYAVLARDVTWMKLYELDQDPDFVPMGFGEVEPLLPVLAWPV